MLYPLQRGSGQVHVSEPVLAREIFDRLRQATAGNPEVLAELCRDYLAEAQTTVAQLRDALAQNDAAGLRDRAHYLKGSSMTLGARQLSIYCGSLERMGREGDLAEAPTELERVVSGLQAVQLELSRELGPVVLPGEGSAA